jgi:ribonuclease HI
LGACAKKLQKCTKGGDYLLDLLEELFGKCMEEEMEFFAVIIRSIWFRRNKVVHGGEFIPPKQIIQEAQKAQKEFYQANAKDGVVDSQQRPKECTHWCPPVQGIYKVNWDAALDSTNNRMGIGIIVRDYLGMVIAAKSYTMRFISEPVVAEALAALHAAEFSRDLGLPMVILEGDSLQVVTTIQGTGPNWSSYGHIVADIRIVLHELRSWQICHSKRTNNYAAHGLAKEAVLNVMNKVWMEEISNCICDVVSSELYALVS